MDSPRVRAAIEENALDPTGGLVNSEGTELRSGSMRIRAPISDDVEDTSPHAAEATPGSSAEESAHSDSASGLSDNLDKGDEMPVDSGDGDTKGQEDVLDSESATNSSSLHSGSMAIRAPVSDDIEDEVTPTASKGNMSVPGGAESNMQASPETSSQSYSTPMPIRAPISDDVEDDEIFREEEDEDEDAEEDVESLASAESFDSALERMATSSTNDVDSPVGSFSDPLITHAGSPSGSLSGLNEKEKEQDRQNVEEREREADTHDIEDGGTVTPAKEGGDVKDDDENEESGEGNADNEEPKVPATSAKDDEDLSAAIAETSKEETRSHVYAAFLNNEDPSAAAADTSVSAETRDTSASGEASSHVQPTGSHDGAVDTAAINSSNDSHSYTVIDEHVGDKQTDSKASTDGDEKVNGSLSSSDIATPVTDNSSGNVRIKPEESQGNANESTDPSSKVTGELGSAAPEPASPSASLDTESSQVKLDDTRECEPIAEDAGKKDRDYLNRSLISQAELLHSQESSAPDSGALSGYNQESSHQMRPALEPSPSAMADGTEAKGALEGRVNVKGDSAAKADNVVVEKQESAIDSLSSYSGIAESSEGDGPVGSSKPDDANIPADSMSTQTPPLEASASKEDEKIVKLSSTTDAEVGAKDDADEKEGSFSRSSPPSVSNKESSAPATDTRSLGGAGPSLPVRPAGLGRSVPSLEHGPRPVQRSSGGSAPQHSASSVVDRSMSEVSEGSDDARKKLQMIRVKFLRLAHRLGQSAHNVVVAQVLYRLGLAEQLRGDRASGRADAFSFERASVLAEEEEAAGQDDLDFECTIMVLGKSGVGKSATINTLFDEVMSGTDAYTPATKKVQEVIGTVHGIKLRVIDTPGLLNSFADQRRNEKIMASVKRFIKKSPPDIVLYFDRLDMPSRDYGDLPLLRTITETFGAAIWFNAIVVLTHASSAPPDGANGVPVSYEMFVGQRSHVVQQTIRQAAGDMRLMNPVSLVENHSACRTNRAGQRVLPNGQVWKPQLLLLCFASKILAEANSLLKLQDNTPGKPFGVRTRAPPLPFLLSSLLQSRAQLKFPDEQMGDIDESESSDEDVDSEDEEEYDDLPPFRRLTREELGLLDKEQQKAYFEEVEYRERLFMKKQLKEERIRRREMKRRLAALPKEAAQLVEESFEEENASAAVPVPMPDMALPPSFDSDNPTYRYRCLDTSNQWLVRPVLETHGWDHDSGYDGLNVEKSFVIKKKIPASVSGQVTKDKKEANMQMECAASIKTGEGKVTLAGLDIQTVGKDLAYTLRSETRFDNFKRNKTTCGLAVTLLGNTIAAGMKLEDRLMVGKRFKLVVNGGALTGRGDVAYGGSLEATFRDKDYPIGRNLSTLGLSVMDWHGDLAIGGNLQVQFQLGKTMLIGRANLNNRGAGQISIRASSSEQLQMALIGLIPLLRTLGSKLFNPSESMQ